MNEIAERQYKEAKQFLANYRENWLPQCVEVNLLVHFCMGYVRAYEAINMAVSATVTGDVS